MLVEEIMKTNVVTLFPDNTIADAISLMREKKIRHLPIVNQQNQLVGLVTDRDIKEAAPSILEEAERKDIMEKPLESIMKTDIITGHPLDFVEEVTALFYEHKIGCLPIMKDNRLVGIITETDLFHTLVELTGAHQPGSLIEVKVPNKEGMLWKIANVIHSHNTNIQSVLVYPDKKEEGYKTLVIRVQTMNPINIINDLKKEGLRVLWPNFPGIKS